MDHYVTRAIDSASNLPDWDFATIIKKYYVGIRRRLRKKGGFVCLTSNLLSSIKILSRLLRKRDEYFYFTYNNNNIKTSKTITKRLHLDIYVLVTHETIF